MHADSQASSYYPPRARWYSSLWRWWYPVRRRLYLDRLPGIARHDLCQPLWGMVLPGWALLWSKRPILGVILGTIYCLSAPVFLIWAGYPLSNLALTVMISIHAGSIVRVEQSVGLWKRMAFSLLVFFLVAEGVYVPLRNQLERRWFVPLRVGDHVVVVQTGAKHNNIHRGDWVAYRIGAVGEQHIYEAGVYVRGECVLGRVLAVEGDEVRFQGNGLLVNGELQPRDAHMPSEGALQVPEGCWFIWPKMNINGHGYVAPQAVDAALLQLATVTEKDFVGVPYQRWFWREQTVP